MSSVGVTVCYLVYLLRFFDDDAPHLDYYHVVSLR